MALIRVEEFVCDVPVPLDDLGPRETWAPTGLTFESLSCLRLICDPNHFAQVSIEDESPLSMLMHIAKAKKGILPYLVESPESEGFQLYFPVPDAPPSAASWAALLGAQRDGAAPGET